MSESDGADAVWTEERAQARSAEHATREDGVLAEERSDHVAVIRTLSSKVVYENKWTTVREDEIERQDGSRGIYGVVDKPDFAVVIPMENDGFHLVEQYRYPIGRRTWEFPSGAFPDGATGTLEELAARELVEETGFTAGRLADLGGLNLANSMTGQRFHVFLATDLTPGEPRREVEEQDMRQAWFPRGEVERMIASGAIDDSSILAAYLLLTMRDLA